jgi:hypothetical protein
MKALSRKLLPQKNFILFLEGTSEQRTAKHLSEHQILVEGKEIRLIAATRFCPRRFILLFDSGQRASPTFNVTAEIHCQSLPKFSRIGPPPHSTFSSH